MHRRGRAGWAPPAVLASGTSGGGAARPPDRRPPADADDLAETTYLVEAESSLKANAPLRGKVEQLSAACETLGAARGVLWIVRTRDVTRRLRDLGVDYVRRLAHFLVPARDLGMDGEDIGPVRRPWWALQVPPDSPAA